MPEHVHPGLAHSYVTESALTETGLALAFSATVDGNAVLPAASATNLIGIATATAAIGDRVDLVREGYVKARVNGAATNIARGDKLGVTTTGRLVKATAAGAYFIAEAQQAATADGVLISVLVTRGTIAG